MREIAERLKEDYGIQVSINAVQKWRTTGNIREEVIGPLCEILKINLDDVMSASTVQDIDILELMNDINGLRADQKYALRLLVNSMLKTL